MTSHDTASAAPRSWDESSPYEPALLVRRGDGEAQERTRELLGRLGDATEQERRRIRDEVIGLHLWLADNLARRYGLPDQRDDLVQVARIGLVEAFDRYDPDRATSYAYFAWVTTNGLLRRHLRDHGWSVRPPRSTQEAANVLRSAVPALAQELGRAPTRRDLAAHLGWTPEAVDRAHQAELGLRAASIEALGDAWTPEHDAELDVVEARVLLRRAVRDLGEQDRHLLRMRFHEEMTQSQIAAMLGVNQMQVSRLLAHLMARLRSEIGELDEVEVDPG